MRLSHRAPALLPAALSALVLGPLLLGPGSGCTSDKAGGDGALTDSGGSGTDPGADGALPAPRDGLTEHFATGGTCAECHSNHDDADALRAPDGSEIGMVDLWGPTMMANALRDPLFRAVVSAEVARHPDAREEIEQACLTCHAPMAATEEALSGDGSITLAEATSGEDVGMLGLDGVSCTVCHQVVDEGLGEEETFDGGYVIEGTGELYGPHADPFTHPMEEHVGYTPVEGDQVLEPGLCATCHTLETPTLVDGTPTGHTLQEQAPFLEWRSSSWGPDGADVACQTCHVPTIDDAGSPIETQIARSPMGHDIGRIDPRSPVGRHSFLGGNTLIPAMIRDNADLLQPAASAEAFDAHLERTRAFLGTQAAWIEVTEATRDGGEVVAEVHVQPRTGHKLPTGHPSRRAWLHVQAVDGSGATVFESGAVDTAGRIVDGSGTPLAAEARGGGIHPHLDVVDSEDEVQVWQSVMADVDGNPTWALLSGASYAKDDRLLPEGWDPAPEDADRIAPVGVEDDEDFGPGTDTVTVRFPAEGPVTLTATLRYQPVSPRYVDELAAVDTPTVASFLAMWEAADRSPETLATHSVEVP